MCFRSSGGPACPCGDGICSNCWRMAASPWSSQLLLGIAVVVSVNFIRAALSMYCCNLLYSDLQVWAFIKVEFGQPSVESAGTFQSSGAKITESVVNGRWSK
mmetsp:Transcript_24982/g.66478  ORF Transcript_24982/g.66478 Transcript_24982/m.66478 type:complete len:102 (+) Transcript_24982:658-963(+)